MNEETLIKEFHRMWDAFPGIARLLNRKHEIVAANEYARQNGFVEGTICYRVGLSESHRNCLMRQMFSTGQTQLQRFGEDKIKGWMPVEGNSEYCIHFSMTIPVNVE